MPLVLENELVSILKLIQQLKTVGFYYIVLSFYPLCTFTS